MQQMTQLMMMDALSRLRERDDETGTNAIGAGKALKKLHAMQERVRTKPRDVVADYLEETTRVLNVRQGDAWALADFTSRISWGRMRGLHRIHWHASFILEHLVRGETDEAAGYLTQLLRAVHQVCLDGGNWTTARHMLPRSDPLEHEQFGGTQAEFLRLSGSQGRGGA